MIGCSDRTPPSLLRGAFCRKYIRLGDELVGTFGSRHVHLGKVIQDVLNFQDRGVWFQLSDRFPEDLLQPRAVDISVCGFIDKKERRDGIPDVYSGGYVRLELPIQVLDVFEELGRGFAEPVDRCRLDVFGVQRCCHPRQVSRIVIAGKEVFEIPNGEVGVEVIPGVHHVDVRAGLEHGTDELVVSSLIRHVMSTAVN